jgi:hypothetical protein
MRLNRVGVGTGPRLPFELYIFGSAGQLLRCSALSKVHVAVQAGPFPESPSLRVQKKTISKAKFEEEA